MMLSGSHHVSGEVTQLGGNSMVVNMAFDPDPKFGPPGKPLSCSTRSSLLFSQHLECAQPPHAQLGWEPSGSRTVASAFKALKAVSLCACSQARDLGLPLQSVELVPQTRSDAQRHSCWKRCVTQTIVRGAGPEGVRFPHPCLNVPWCESFPIYLLPWFHSSAKWGELFYKRTCGHFFFAEGCECGSRSDG